MIGTLVVKVSNAFFLSHFGYYPLGQIFHNCGKNDLEPFIVIRNSSSMNYQKNVIAPIYEQNLLFLGIKMFKFKRGLTPAL